MAKVPLVIVGGGIQGLCLLREAVQKGIDAVLFTKDRIGDGETLHSHAIMSGGSWASGPVPQAACAESIAALRKTLSPQCVYSAAQFLFILDKPGNTSLPLDENAMKATWANLKIPNTMLPAAEIPELFRGEALLLRKVIYKSAVDGVYNDIAVVRELAAAHKERIRQGELVNVELSEDGKDVKTATFKLHSGLQMQLQPEHLILATGAWTPSLLHRALSGAASAVLSPLLAQATGRGLFMPMIIIRGKELPRTAAFAMTSGIIWGYSETDTGTPEWRCTPTSAMRTPPVPYLPTFDHRNPPCPPAEVRGTIGAIEGLIPGFAKIKTSLHYAVYAEYRTEHPTGHERPPVPSILHLNNCLHTVVPGMWQHSFTASTTALAKIAPTAGSSAHSAVQAVSAAPEAALAPRKVDTLSWMNWEDFSAKYLQTPAL